MSRFLNEPLIMCIRHRVASYLESFHPERGQLLTDQYLPGRNVNRAIQYLKGSITDALIRVIESMTERRDDLSDRRRYEWAHLLPTQIRR